MDKEVVSNVESPQSAPRSVPLLVYITCHTYVLTQNSMNEKLNAEEQGHIEVVNLQNNLSAKYVVDPPHRDVDISLT